MSKSNKTSEGQYIKMPVGLLYHQDLKLAEKVFLSIVFSLSKDGLKLTNQALGRMLCLNETNTSRMIAKLDREGWTRTTGKGTRWRRIYIAADSKVKEVLHCRWEHFTLPLTAKYLAAESKPNKRNKRNNKKPSFLPTLAEPEKPSKPAQAPPDPEKLARVMVNLGFAAEGGL